MTRRAISNQNRRARITEPQSGALPSGGPGHLIAAGLLLFVVAGAFLPCLRNGFVDFDDPQYVTENLQVQAGLTTAGFGWAFHATVGGNWHPLTWLSHMLDCQLFGLHAWGHHLTSVLLHSLNALLLLALLARLTKRFWPSLIVTAIFGLHPLRVESVAWVAERKDLLGGFFFLSTILVYAEFVSARTCDARRYRIAGFYVLALVLFVLGLMSKPMLVTLPFILLLLDYWPLERWRPASWNGPLVVEKAPFFALGVVFSIIAYHAQAQGGALRPDLDLGNRLENSVVSYWRYLGKTIWPSHLSVFYPHPGTWDRGLVIGAGLGILALTLAAWIWRKRCPWLFVGWLWFAGMLVPVIGLVQIGGQSIADRYTYLPSIGLLVAIVWAADALTASRRLGPPPLAVVAGVPVILCVSLTWRQIGNWRDGESLYRHAIAVTSNNSVAQYNLGLLMTKQGRLEEAASLFEQAVLSDPKYAKARNNLGAVLARLGRLDEAASQFQAAVRIDPLNAEAHANRGAIFQEQGKLDAALSELTEALRLRPASAEAHYNLGLTLEKLGRVDEAIAELQTTLTLDPSYPEATERLENLLARKVGSR